MNRFLKQAIDDKEEMIGNRRFLHRNPEIRDDLPITAKFVSEKLTEYGIPNKEICKCGIVGIIGGKKPGKTVMLRTDMDALPIKENSGRNKDAAIMPFGFRFKKILVFPWLTV